MSDTIEGMTKEIIMCITDYTEKGDIGKNDGFKIVEHLKSQSQELKSKEEEIDTLEDNHDKLLKDYITDITSLKKRIESLENKINTPHFGDFNEALKVEMAHHLDRWGDESLKYPAHFQSVISYISGKLIKAIWNNDIKKYEHHLITIAAVCGTAHKYLMDENTMSAKWFNKKFQKLLNR